MIYVIYMLNEIRLYHVTQIFIMPKININICEINEKILKVKNQASIIREYALCNYKILFYNQQIFSDKLFLNRAIIPILYT